MTIKAKIIVANFMVFGLLLSGLALFLYGQIAKNEMQAIDSRLETCSAKIITEFEDEWDEEKEPEWDDILLITAEGLDVVYMSLQDIAGNIVFHNDSLPIVQAQTLNQVIANGVVHETIVHMGKRSRKAIFPVSPDERVEFILTLITPIEDVDSRLNMLALILIVSVPVALLLASIAIYFVTRFAFSPMSRMVTAAEQISGENLDRRIELPSSSDEVARLGAALNNMMDRIEAAFKSQRQFVADASHELRTPITVIVGELEYVQRKIEDERARSGVDIALSELDRLAMLVDQLLTLSRIDARKLILDMKAARLDELLIECVQLLQRETERRGLRLDVYVKEAVEIRCDAARIKSVILNLLDNAIQFTPEGAISISLKLSNSVPQYAQVSISDSGPGIPEEDLPRIFDRFFRAASARAICRGRGLGLAITRELIELHGGHINVKSQEGVGTTFTVDLPMGLDQ